MPRFKITYRDPETGEDATHVGEYEATPAETDRPDGLRIGAISARQWAEDHAYSLADKGP